MRFVDAIEIVEHEAADAARAEIQRRGTAEPAQADDEHPGAAELGLPFSADVRERDLPRVALTHAALLRSSSSTRGRPARSSCAAATRQPWAAAKRDQLRTLVRTVLDEQCAAWVQATRRFGKQDAVRVEPVRAAVERELRLERQRPDDLRRAHVRRVADDHVETLGGQRFEPARRDPTNGGIERAERGTLIDARLLERVGAHVEPRDACVAAAVLDGERDGAAAGADVEHRGCDQRGTTRESNFDEQLGLRPWNQHVRRHEQRQRKELAAADDVRDRLATDAPRDELGELEPLVTRHRTFGERKERRMRPVGRVRQQQQRIEARRFTDTRGCDHAHGAANSASVRSHCASVTVP